MPLIDDITVLILTFNEEANIGRTLAAVSWARQILIVDSGSTDTTLEIVHSNPQAKTVTRPFDTFANQCNFGLGNITTPWVLSLDADYVLTADLSREIGALQPVGHISGYRTGFVYCMYGAPLRRTLYPPRCTLYRRSSAHYMDEGHGHRVAINGAVTDLSGKILHDDRKSLSRWLAAQLRYAKVEADHLLAAPRSALGLSDRVRLMGWPAPPLVLLYSLLWKGCLFDGWPGWLYVLQRTFAETALALEIVDRRVRKAVGQTS